MGMDDEVFNAENQERKTACEKKSYQMEKKRGKEETDKTSLEGRGFSRKILLGISK